MDQRHSGHAVTCYQHVLAVLILSAPLRNAANTIKEEFYVFLGSGAVLQSNSIIGFSTAALWMQTHYFSRFTYLYWEAKCNLCPSVNWQTWISHSGPLQKKIVECLKLDILLTLFFCEGCPKSWPCYAKNKKCTLKAYNGICKYQHVWMGCSKQCHEKAQQH